MELSYKISNVMGITSNVSKGLAIEIENVSQCTTKNNTKYCQVKMTRFFTIIMSWNVKKV